MSAIDGYIHDVKDASIKKQIDKKIKKVKENPLIGEKKRFGLKGVYAVR